MTATRAELAAVVAAFATAGELLDARPYGGGHIHDSYLVACGGHGRSQRYLLQRINTRVFADPAALMHNIARITTHLRGKLGGQRPCLELVVAHGGDPWVRDEHGGWWRSYRYIDGSVSYASVRDATMARSAARAYGEFQRLLADLPAPRLAESIAEFHATPRRVEQLEQACARDPCGRAAAAAAEIALALARRPGADALLALQRAGTLPERIVHNDSKLDNVLFDASTDAVLCVVDLDTTMPGLTACDFGDLVRSCVLAREDRAPSGPVRFDLDLYEALLRGYLEGTGALLTAAERAALPLGCRLISYELGVRFLTDYLEGDVYFKTVHPQHNLERARAQLGLMCAMEREERAMQERVAQLTATAG